MREILFRGKRLGNGEWVSGFYCTKDGTHFITDIGTYASGKNYFNDIIVDHDTVGQFTGMLDANGKKIFEGDYVQLDEKVKEIFDVNDGVIKYIGGFFIVSGSNAGIRGSLHTLSDINWVLRGVVIGNIHDNPELIGKESN